MNAKTSSRKTCCKTDRSDQGRFVDIFFHNASGKSGGHAQKEDGDTERPFHLSFGTAEIFGNVTF